MRSPVPSAAMGPVLSASQYAKMPGVIGHGGVAHAGHLHPSLPTSQHVAAVGKKPGPPWRLPSAAPLKAQAKNTKTRMPSKIWCDQQLALHGKHTGRSTPVTALDSFACLLIETCMRFSFLDDKAVRAKKRMKSRQAYCITSHCVLTRTHNIFRIIQNAYL